MCVHTTYTTEHQARFSTNFPQTSTRVRKRSQGREGTHLQPRLALVLEVMVHEGYGQLLAASRAPAVRTTRGSRPCQCRMHSVLRRDAGRDAIQIEDDERRQRAAVERGGKSGAACVGDLGVAGIGILQICQPSSRQRQRRWRWRRRRDSRLRELLERAVKVTAARLECPLHVVGPQLLPKRLRQRPQPVAGAAEVHGAARIEHVAQLDEDVALLVLAQLREHRQHSRRRDSRLRLRLQHRLALVLERRGAASPGEPPGEPADERKGEHGDGGGDPANAASAAARLRVVVVVWWRQRVLRF
eukprot:scaffold77420_cov63-Phaeocystis_antarctica.AAC.4